MPKTKNKKIKTGIGRKNKLNLIYYYKYYYYFNNIKNSLENKIFFINFFYLINKYAILLIKINLIHFYKPNAKNKKQKNKNRHWAKK